MATPRVLLLVCLMAGLAASQTPAQQISFGAGEAVRGWYQKYLGREPSRAEVRQMLDQMNRGASAEQIQAGILASEEYYNRRRRNPTEFVNGLYLDILSRSPSSSDRAFWLNSLFRLQGNRLAMVEEFLRAAARDGHLYPQPPQEIAGTAAQMSNVARLFNERVRAELGGTYQGQQLLIRGNTLQVVCDQFNQAVRFNNFNQAQARVLLANIEQAYRGVLDVLHNPAGTAPGASQVAWYVGRLIGQARQQLGVAAGTPGGPPVNARLLQYAVALSTDVQQLIGLIQQQQAFQPGGNSELLRQVVGFGAQVESFRGQIQSGIDQNALRTSYYQVRAGADLISATIQSRPTSGLILQVWYRAQGQLDGMARELNISSGGGFFPPWQPPGQPQPPAFQPNVTLLRTIDRTASDADAFISSLSPFVLRVNQMPQMISEMREFRNALYQFREQAAAGNRGFQLSNQYNQVSRQFNQAYSLWRNITRADPLLNPTALDRMAEQIRECGRLVN